MQHQNTPEVRQDEPSVDLSTACDFKPGDLLSTAQCSEVTGLGRATLRTYGSWRRCHRYLGPKPSRIPGLNALVYKWEDVQAYIVDGHTGAPGDPNHDGGDL